MFIRALFLLAITSWFQVNCYVPVAPIYRKAEEALHRYSSNFAHNPVIYSLLNILVHDKQATAFVSDEAIDLSLNEIKKYNVKDEKVLRQIIHDTRNPLESSQLSPNVKEQIISALDTFFSNSNTDDYRTFDLLSAENKS
jgi:hypothetical protein